MPRIRRRTAAGLRVSIPLTLTLSLAWRSTRRGDPWPFPSRARIRPARGPATGPTDRESTEPSPGAWSTAASGTWSAARTRRYYDEPRDEQDRRRYYSGIDPDGGTLSEDLGRLISDTHTNRLKYKEARIVHLYAWVDLQREKDVRSIYSDERFDPSKFIKEDFVLERRVERLIERRRARESSLAGESLERMLAVLEAQEPFNCEHVVPQSWFDDKAPMQGDLHHLFACQHQCNSFRGTGRSTTSASSRSPWRRRTGPGAASPTTACSSRSWARGRWRGPPCISSPATPAGSKTCTRTWTTGSGPCSTGTNARR